MFFKTVNKNKKIANLLNKILGANFPSKPIGYKPTFFFASLVLKTPLPPCMIVGQNPITNRVKESLKKRAKKLAFDLTSLRS